MRSARTSHSCSFGTVSALSTFRTAPIVFGRLCISSIPAGGEATLREIPVRELFLVISVMGAGYLSIQTTHRIVGQFLEKPGTADVTLDMPVDLACDTRGLTRAEILSHARKCRIKVNSDRLSPAEKEWHSCLSAPQPEHFWIARFVRSAASVSSNDFTEEQSQALR